MKAFRIYDFKGVQVHRSKVLSGQQVDVSQLVPGIYIGELNSNGKERIQLKLVKF